MMATARSFISSIIHHGVTAAQGKTVFSGFRGEIERMPLILAIESSCDETAAAVVRDGQDVLSNVVASQFAAHHLYEGVVPELAAREHLRAIAPVVRQALAEAKISLDDVDA